LSLAGLILLASSYLAFRREPWPGAFGTPLSANWWTTLWSSIPHDLPTYNIRFNSVAAVPGTNSFVAVGSGGAIVRSSDNGRTWSDVLWTGQSSDFLRSVSFGDAKSGWAVGDDGVIIGSSGESVGSTTALDGNSDANETETTESTVRARLDSKSL